MGARGYRVSVEAVDGWCRRAMARAKRMVRTDDYLVMREKLRLRRQETQAKAADLLNQ